nr:ATP-binding cassette domain-containing protein [Clostridium sp. AM58-1XD]
MSESPVQGDYIIETRGLTKCFGDFTAVREVSLKVKRGEILCIIGENGAGKSTLMNMLYGLLSPTRGEIWINSRQVRMSLPRTPSKTASAWCISTLNWLPA